MTHKKPKCLICEKSCSKTWAIKVIKMGYVCSEVCLEVLQLKLDLERHELVGT